MKNVVDRSVVILGGNHKAFSRTGGSHGKVESFHCQRGALTLACQLYNRAIQEGRHGHLYTAIDHLGGARILTGKRGNPEILTVDSLIPVVRESIQEILEQNDVPPEKLKILPERTLIAHSQRLHEAKAFDQQVACSAFSATGRAVCKGLAATYIDFAVRDATKFSEVGFVDWFVESQEGTAVPSIEIYKRGAAILRGGMVTQNNFPNWTEHVQIRGFHVLPNGKIMQVS